jgi:hypothetical protein
MFHTAANAKFSVHLRLHPPQHCCRTNVLFVRWALLKFLRTHTVRIGRCGWYSQRLSTEIITRADRYAIT